jgi:hypothetical protein
MNDLPPVKLATARLCGQSERNRVYKENKENKETERQRKGRS